MSLSKKEADLLIQELIAELSAKLDGGRKNLIVPKCPFCGKGGGKYGIYIGKETERKKQFMSHCFSCGHSTFTIEQLLIEIGRTDLIVSEKASLEAELDTNILFKIDQEEDEIDDSLVPVELPDFYKQRFKHPYLKDRGFTMDDFEFFPVGSTGSLNFKFEEYVIFPIIDSGIVAGYVSRHTWSKKEIDDHNREAARKGGYKIMRYRNSTENDFVKLLYNYDSVIEDETDTVILVEGVFDVIALTRKLDLYDNSRIAVVATFGKKISNIQMYKLQQKGVRTVVIAYDGDAVDSIKKAAENLNVYFDVFVADIPYADKDFDDLNFGEIYEIFSTGLKTPLQYKLNKVQGMSY